MIPTLFLIAAFALFVLATLRMTSRFDLTAAGLACSVAAQLWFIFAR